VVFKPVRRFFLISLFALLPVSAFAAGGLSADGAWIRQAPPGMKMLAGYLTVSNHGAKPRSVVAASSPAFGHIELHRSVIQNGVAKMIPQMSITIPAHGELHFAPGGYHLMLMKPKRAFKLGEMVPLTLRFANGQTITVQAVVKRGEM
jgi:periplasmic copper chaperone A